MNTGTHVIVLFRTCKRSTFYYFKKWYFLGFSHYLAFPCLKTYLPLSHQLPLSGWSCFDQSTSSGSDGLGRLQNLLLEVQALVCFLFYERKRETICQHLRCMAFSNRSRLYWNIQMSTGKHLSVGGGLRGGARRDLRPRSTTSVRFCVSVKTFADLGFGSGPQLLQFLGSSFNGRGRSQQLVLCNDSGVLGVHPLGACNTQQQQTLGLGKSWHLISCSLSQEFYKPEHGWPQMLDLRNTCRFKVLTEVYTK